MNNNLESTKQKCLILLDFLKIKAGNDGQIFIEQFVKSVEVSFLNGNLKELKSTLRDLVEWTSGIIPHEKKEVITIISTVENLIEKEVFEIIEKGNIQNDKEYKYVLNYVDKSVSSIKKIDTSLINKANELLMKYDN